MPIGIQPLGSRLRRRCRSIKPRIIKNGKNSLTNCIARPRQVRRDLLIGAGFIGNSCRKELICIVLRRDVAANRDGPSIGSTGRLGRRCKSEDSCHDHHHDGQQAAVQFTHGDHVAAKHSNEAPARYVIVKPAPPASGSVVEYLLVKVGGTVGSVPP